jgi:PAS domain S-box-containing protein
LIGKPWQIPESPKDLGKATASEQVILDVGRSEFEVLVMRKDGTTFWKPRVKVRNDDGHGQSTGHYCFTKDITERTLAERPARENVSHG